MRCVAAFLLLCVLGSVAEALVPSQSDLGFGVGPKDAPGPPLTIIPASQCGGFPGPNSTAGLAQCFATPNVEIVIPPGTYVIAPTSTGSGPPMLMPSSNQYIHCQPGAIFQYAAGTLDGGNAGRMISNLDGAGVVHQLVNWRMDGCIFDGNCRGNATPCAGGPTHTPQTEIVAILRGENVYLEHNLFYDVPYIGMAYYTGSNVHFDNNAFYKVGQLINNDPFQCNGCQNFTVNGNVVDDTGEGLVVQSSTATLAKEGTGAVMTPAKNGVVNDNTIAILPANAWCQGTAQPFACCTGEKTGNSTGLCAAGVSAGGSIIVDGQHITVAGNVLEGANTINVEAVGGGRGDGTATFDTFDVTVAANTMTNGLANCIGAFVVDPVSPEQSIYRIHIVGNHCYNPAASGISVGAGTSGSAFNITIADDYVINPSFTGILMQYPAIPSTGTMHDITIKDSEIDTPCSGQPVGTCASVLTTPDAGETFSNIILDHNVFKGSARYQLWLFGLQSQLRVENNDFLNPTTAIVDPGTVGTVAHWMYNRYVAPAFFGIVPSAPTVAQFISDEPVTFALLTGTNVLNTVSDGSRVPCSNCTYNSTTGVCNTGGTGTVGRLAIRMNGNWCCATGGALTTCQ